MQRYYEVLYMQLLKAGDGWKYSEERKALYKVNAQNNPVVDFSSSDSLPFFKVSSLQEKISLIQSFICGLFC